MTQIRICGAGGQGIVLAGILVGQAGMLDGKHSAQACSYGSEARGSACQSEVVLSEEWIDFPHVVEVDILVSMSQQGYDKYRGEMRPEGSRIFFDSDLVRTADGGGVPHHAVPATAIALERLHRRVVANMVMLGAVAAATQVVTRQSLEQALRRAVNPGTLDVNLEALDAGFVFGGELRL